MESYGQYCPLAKGAEVFAERWTPLILRELLRGSTTFNDLHRGVPSMSRSLLSSRLKKLEACGVLQRRVSTGTHYELTPAGQELGSVVTQLGTWAQRWYRSTFTGAELDVGVLMWDIRCTVNAKALPAIRTVVQFIFSDLRASSRAWWLVNEDGEVDLCPVDPGDNPKLQICTTLRTMTRVWMGDLSIDTVLRSGALTIVGSRDLRRCFGGWLRLSPYAPVADARRASHQFRGDQNFQP
ncbi:MAG: helix-turn-helix transcriptional regulator [Pseudomonadota bacterium]|nr:helix-turn-helix transcriptional regulator [Pseudomonadota bacterium]